MFKVGLFVLYADVLCIRTLCHRTLVYSQRLPLPLTWGSGCFSKPSSCLIVSLFLQIVMHLKHYTRPVFQVFAVPVISFVTPLGTVKVQQQMKDTILFALR